MKLSIRYFFVIVDVFRYLTPILSSTVKIIDLGTHLQFHINHYKKSISISVGQIIFVFLITVLENLTYANINKTNNIIKI